jgi:hypothetical protein
MKPRTLTAEETMCRRDLIDEYRRHQIEIKRLRALCAKYKDEVKELQANRTLLLWQLEVINGNCS